MKTALVTGANRGIGLELTMQLLDSGYNVHATYRSNKGGLDEINNSALSIHQMDVRNKEDRTFRERKLGYGSCKNAG